MGTATKTDGAASLLDQPIPSLSISQLAKRDMLDRVIARAAAFAFAWYERAAGNASYGFDRWLNLYADDAMDMSSAQQRVCISRGWPTAPDEAIEMMIHAAAEAGDRALD